VTDQGHHKERLRSFVRSAIGLCIFMSFLLWGDKRDGMAPALRCFALGAAAAIAASVLDGRRTALAGVMSSAAWASCLAGLTWGVLYLWEHDRSDTVGLAIWGWMLGTVAIGLPVYSTLHDRSQRTASICGWVWIWCSLAALCVLLATKS